VTNQANYATDVDYGSATAEAFFYQCYLPVFPLISSETADMILSQLPYSRDQKLRDKE